MKKLITFLILFVLLGISSNHAQDKTEYLTRAEIENDLKFLSDILENKSSYQGLNGFDYRKDFDNYLQKVKNKKISKSDFGLFLSQTIGKIGDRHSYIKGYDLPETLYFPFSFAPYNDKVLVINYEKSKQKYSIFNSKFPYLKSINNIAIEKILQQIRPNDQLAPKKSYLLDAVRDLRDIETVFSIMKIKLPNPLPIKLENENGIEKSINVKLVSDGDRGYLWDERFHKKDFYFFAKAEKLNDKTLLEQFFSINDNIGYIQVHAMLDRDESPLFFQLLNGFMQRAKDTEALIIDVRDNGGGSRDLINEFAGYFIDTNLSML
ncbi:MAG: S41 family peptidase [Bacteroidota bacterium]